jgi:hypothetical protein
MGVHWAISVFGFRCRRGKLAALFKQAPVKMKRVKNGRGSGGIQECLSWTVGGSICS